MVWVVVFNWVGALSLLGFVGAVTQAKVWLLDLLSRVPQAGGCSRLHDTAPASVPSARPRRFLPFSAFLLGSFTRICSPGVLRACPVSGPACMEAVAPWGLRDRLFGASL